MSLFEELNELIRSGSDQELTTFIRYLQRRNLQVNYAPLLKEALQRGQVERVIFLLRLLQNSSLILDILSYASQLRSRGSRYLIEKLVQLANSPDWNKILAVGAAYYPELTSRVLYLISHGADNFEEILDSAVRGNNLSLIRELLNRYGLQPIEQVTMECNLPVLKYLLDQVKLTASELEVLKSILRSSLTTSYSSSSWVERCLETLEYLESISPEIEKEVEEYFFYPPLE